jgi:hypothetical protein
MGDIGSNPAQGESVFLNPDDNPRLSADEDMHLVAHIYFPTNVTELDDDDLRALDRLKLYYNEERLRQNHVYFAVIGFADWRQADNLRLSQERARHVRRFLDNTIGICDNIDPNRAELAPNEGRHVEEGTNCRCGHYHCTSQGNGVWGTVADGRSSRQLNRFRVAEIFARTQPVPPPLPEPTPTPETTRIRLARSTHFKIRLLQGVGADIPFTPLSGNWNAVEIVDVQNNIRMFFKYTGSGFGVSLPVNVSGSSSWLDVYTTPFELHVSNFGGPALHWGFGLQVGRGYTEDYFILFGLIRYGGDTVALRFRGAWSEKGLNLGGGADVGVLENRGRTATAVPPDYTTGSYPMPWQS